MGSGHSAENDALLSKRVRIAQRAASQWGRENDDAQYVSEVLADVAAYIDYIESRCDAHPSQPKACYLCL